MPPLPIFHGVLDLGEGPMAIMSEGPKGAHRDYQPGTNVVLSCPDANWCGVRKIGACIVWILPGLLLSRRCCNSRMTPVVLTEYLILQTVLANHTRPNEKKMQAGTKAHSGNFLQTREGGGGTSTP